MPHALLGGLSLVDATGRVILATTLLCLFLAVAANLFLRARYVGLRRDLERDARPFAHPLLNHVVADALEASRRTGAPNTQAIVEERFQSELKALLLAERFVKAATGLVIILGLLGTFYGLTLSIGRIVSLVSTDGGGADVAGAVTAGLTRALSGMAVAFSNSLLGIASAVVLTALGVFCGVTDHRIALMLKLETHLDRVLASSGSAAAREDGGARFPDTVKNLENVVARFESALATFSENARDFHEFNAHLKDNIQRMSLSFGDLSDTLKGHAVALKSGR